MSDHQAILNVLQTYFDSIYVGDTATLRTVFHPQAALFGEIKGQPYYKVLGDYLDAVANRQSPKALGEPFAMKTLSIDLLDNVAFAKAHCRMLGFNYYDYLSLLKHEGRWVIVNKLFTHVAH
ncbi:MAG: nuclear transport factor 2 family protein [Nitrosomonadales bacterium]|nr:nuclear transport factor 2 family protein [Nitrosomonadales bacterium]